MKIGDRVRTVREIGECPVPTGSVVTLVAVEDIGFDFLTEDGQKWYGNANAFEPLPAPSALSSWEPIEYRSQPDANGDCDFIQWDGIKGGWMVLSDAVTWATPEVFPTPEAAAEWVAKENANG